MKKVVSILLVIAMFITLACGCNKDDDPTIDSKSSDTKQGRLLKKYVDINKSGKYMIDTQISSNGTTFPASIAIYNKDKKMLSFTLKLDETQELAMSVVINGDKKMLILSNFKLYGYLDENQLSYLINMLESSYLQLNKLSFVESGKTTINDKEYEYEDYKNPQTYAITRFVFDDKKLVMTSAVKDGKAEEYIEMTISGDVTAEMFEAPSDFKEDKNSIDTIANTLDTQLNK